VDWILRFGVLVFWRFGVLAFWRFGVLEFWSFGVLALEFCRLFFPLFFA